VDYYRGIFTNTGLERMTGINQKLFNHYSKGRKNPSEKQMNKIIGGIRQFAEDAMTIES
jgi:hypothetical protein